RPHRRSAAGLDGREQAGRPCHREPPRLAHRGPARAGRHPDGVTRPHLGADRPSEKAYEARGRRRRRGMTRRPIGLAPHAPAEGSGQDAKKYSTRNPLVRRLIASWLEIVRLAVSQPYGIVVDVGVGEGLALKQIIPAGSGVVGVEYRSDKLRLAQEHLEQLAGVVADAGMLPLRDAAADV